MMAIIVSSARVITITYFNAFFEFFFPFFVLLFVAVVVVVIILVLFLPTYFLYKFIQETGEGTSPFCHSYNDFKQL